MDGGVYKVGTYDIAGGPQGGLFHQVFRLGGDDRVPDGPMKIFMALMGLDIGGAETHVMELALELHRRGSPGGAGIKRRRVCGAFGAGWSAPYFGAHESAGPAADAGIFAGTAPGHPAGSSRTWSTPMPGSPHFCAGFCSGA